MKITNNGVGRKASHLLNIPFSPLGSMPIVYNITPNAEYCKNGDLIKLYIACDQANYSIFANFSVLDNQFLPEKEQIMDYQNGNYSINYILSLNNTKPNGIYPITIITKNNITGLSIVNTTCLGLDNIIPNIYINAPQNGAFLKTAVISIEGFMNATGSKIRSAAINDSRFGLLTNIIGKDVVNFVIVNNTFIKEGAVFIKITINDSVNLVNHTEVIFTLDNTIPKTKYDNSINYTLSINQTLLFITMHIDGTYSPIKKFEWNISQFKIFFNTTNPIGAIGSQIVVLSNFGKELFSDGKYTLNVTISDSVNLSSSLFIPFILDTIPPSFEAIIQNISVPEYYHSVKVSIVNPRDAVSGIKSIFLSYSTNNEKTWNTVNITQLHYGVIPKFPYQTLVIYKINLTDNYGNSINREFSYTVLDLVPPVIGNIQRQPLAPNQYDVVNISVANVFDESAGVAYIYLNYSINGGLNWILKNITAMKWGLIENQPPNTKVLYQIIVIDNAGNEVKSTIEEYIVQFYYDYNRLVIFIIVIGSIVALSTYSAKKIYSGRKLRKLRLEFLNEKEEFKSYTDLRLEDINILLIDIKSVKTNLTKLLQVQWIPEEIASKSDTLHRYRLIKEFIGITQFSNEINTLKTEWMIKKQEFDAKFHALERNAKFSKQELIFLAKIDACIFFSGTLIRSFRKKYPLYVEGKRSHLKVEYPLNTFDKKLAKIINGFQEKYNDFAKEFDQLLISRKNKLIEDRLNALDQIFKEPDEWLKNAEEWSKILPLPKERGYNYLLKLKKEQYDSIKDEFQLKIEKFRAELSSSIEFAQDFMKWNYDNALNKLKKFEKAIYEDLIRFISTEEIDSSNIDDFIKEKFNLFKKMIEEDKRKVDEFYETHKEFHLQEIFEEWTAFLEEIPHNLKRIRIDLNKYSLPIYRLFKLIRGVTTNFYQNSVNSIEKLNNYGANLIPPNEKFSVLDELFSKVVWEVNRIDNEIKKWIDLLPFDLETQHLIILLKSWSEIKEEVFERLNKLGKEKKIYKCEIMHEILDPLNSEVWECSNCGAIACMEHLEKWYHRKQAPECFKCGKTSTFKLKTFADLRIDQQLS